MDASGRQVPTAWERARRRVDLEDPVVGWTASIGLTLMALFLRLWKLGTPKVFEFDETYYAKDAWSLLHFGYARGYVDERQREDPRRQDVWSVDRRPVDDRPPRGRQVADRAGREGVRDGPVRLADRRGRGRRR